MWGARGSTVFSLSISVQSGWPWFPAASLLDIGGVPLSFFLRFVGWVGVGGGGLHVSKYVSFLFFDVSASSLFVKPQSLHFVLPHRRTPSTHLRWG